MRQVGTTKSASSRNARASNARETDDHTQNVRFVLINPEAHEVFLAGSFNNWNPVATPLIDLRHGRWVKEMWLPPGRHEYQFVVDGRWMHDRTAKEIVENPLGGLNSVIEVSQPRFKAKWIKSMPKRIKRKWTSHYRVLLALRERLLKDRVQQLGEVAQALEPHSMDMADSATDQFDHDLALTALSAEQDALFEVDGAMRRILDGTYGKCQASGKPISEARLRAIPWARFSKQVEGRQEREGVASRTHLPELGSVRGPMARRLQEAQTPEER
jgi:RNA polymerase-binding transcription factor DksA